jgi:hypothetical protein
LGFESIKVCSRERFEGRSHDGECNLEHSRDEAIVY